MGGLICSGQDFSNQAPHKIEGLPRRLGIELRPYNSLATLLTFYPDTIFRSLSNIFSSVAKGHWKSLASHKDINMTATQVALIERLSASKDPSDCVLSGWEVSRRSTVGTMYDLLVDCGFNDVADLL